MHIVIVSVALLFQSSALHYFFFRVCEPLFHNLTKVGLPIFEWAVPRPFVHLRVEIMVLLSMSSDWIFVRINLNAYNYSLRCSFVLKFSAMLFFRVYELLFH